MDTNVETGETRIIKEYNMETRRWESSADLGKDKTKSKKPSTLENQIRINDQPSNTSSIASKKSNPDQEKEKVHS